MNAKRNTQVSVYGSVALVRMLCRDCQRYTFVVDGRTRCCDRSVRFSGEDVRVSGVSGSGSINKKHLPITQKRKILAAQEGRCFYCLRHLETFIWDKKKSRAVHLVACFDHVDPFSRCSSNRESNFVATCQYCNQWKSDTLFKSMSALIGYLKAKWEEVDPGSPHLPLSTVKSIRNDSGLSEKDAQLTLFKI